MTDEQHKLSLLRQYAGACLPDLEYLERQLRSEGQIYRADCLKTRQFLLKSAIAESQKAAA